MGWEASQQKNHCARTDAYRKAECIWPTETTVAPEIAKNGLDAVCYHFFRYYGFLKSG